jgi:hypothetical protein
MARANPHTTIVWDSPICALDINSVVTKDVVKYPHRNMFNMLKQVDMGAQSSHQIIMGTVFKINANNKSFGDENPT